jgi:membrane protein required for beta-lactamase induction
MLSVHILTWKEAAKKENLKNNNYNFINIYATHFFAALFWYVVLPSAIGSLCYLIVMSISVELKNKGLDLIVYNVVVDKMLFYVNVIPYTLLYLFIAIAGDFEAVIHHILQKRKHVTKSYYFLNITLKEVVLLAIGKDKFEITPLQNHDNDENDTESGMLQEEKFTPEIKPYIVAVLYRASIFYLGILALIEIVSIIS